MSNTYQDFQAKTRSSKVVLCHIEPQQRFTVFELDSGSVYKKSVNYVIVGVSENGTSLAKANSSSLSSGEWFYDHIAGDLYVNTSDDSNPNTKTIIATYRLFFSNRPIDLPFDLSNGFDAHYEGRLKTNSPINKQLDEEQIGVVLETSTNLTLENTDGFFDDIYDRLIFENKEVRIWSFSEILPLSEKQKLFDGIIQDKGFSDTQVRFSCKDFTYALREPVALSNFTTSDGNVPERLLNTPKRRLFGQFKQLDCAPVDAILDGFVLTGTITASSQSLTVTGSGTSFLSELSPEDQVIFEAENTTIRLGVKSVESDTSFTISSEPSQSIVNESVKCKPKRPYRNKNRKWNIAGHKLRSPSVEVDTGIEPNRFTVTSTQDIFAGDLVLVDGEQAFVRRISGSQITLSANLQGGIPSNGDTVLKFPVSKVFVNGAEFFYDRDWLIDNQANSCNLELDSLAEFNVAPIIDIPFNLSFTNGSREITVSGVDMKAELQTRDWIRSDDITHTTWYEVLSVVYDNDTTVSTITIRTPYAGSTTTTNAEKKLPDLISEESVLTVNCIGQERDNAWVKTASDAVKDLLQTDAALSNLNLSSFTTSDEACPFTLSYALPRRLGGSTKPIRDVISDINKSVFGSLTVDNDFNLKYEVLSPEKPETIEEIRDDDITSRNISSNSRNEIVKNVFAKYSIFTDRITGEEAFELIEYENEFVSDFGTSKARLDLELFLFNRDEAATIAQRYAFFNSLSQSVISISGKLNLALYNLNDKVYLNLDRLYKRFGSSSKRKIGIVNKITNNGSDVTIQLNDLGASFQRVGVIASNTAPEFTNSTDDQIIKSGFIVDNDTESPDTSSDLEIYSNLIG